MRHDYGLDQPFIMQYVRWMQNLLRGNMGLSLEYQRPNLDLIKEQLVLTIALALMSFVLTWVIAVPAGIYSATHQRSVDRSCLHGGQLHWCRDTEFHAGADPDVGRVLLFRHQRHRPVFARITSMRPGVSRALMDLMAHIWLPAVVLGIAGTARLTRIMRANLLDELNKPYVVTARAKGMREWRLVLRYPVRLALNPLVSTIGWYLPACSPAA